MQRCRQRAAAQRGDSAARLDEIKLAIEANAVLNAQSRVEIQQVDAAAQQHVLAVVDQLGGVVRGESGKEVARPPRNGRASNTSTRKPALPSAAAAESPASPPPITITLGNLHHSFCRPLSGFGTTCSRATTAQPRWPRVSTVLRVNGLTLPADWPANCSK
jgi:hypothetical protein